MLIMPHYCIYLLWAESFTGICILPFKSPQYFAPEETQMSSYPHACFQSTQVWLIVSAKVPPLPYIFLILHFTKNIPWSRLTVSVKTPSLSYIYIPVCNHIFSSMCVCACASDSFQMITYACTFRIRGFDFGIAIAANQRLGWDWLFVTLTHFLSSNKLLTKCIWIKMVLIWCLWRLLRHWHLQIISACCIITRTSEWVITLWRSCELFFRRDISRVCSEISLPKTMNMISTDDQHELVLVFMPYYYWLDVDFNGLCV